MRSQIHKRIIKLKSQPKWMVRCFILLGALLGGIFAFVSHPIGGTSAGIDGYEVKFDSNGGSYVESQMVEEGKYAKEPEKPKKYLFVFKGWYLDESLTQKFDFDNTPIKEDITLYADWKTGYEVKFETFGGNYIESQMIEEGEYVKEPETPKKDGYVFEYWRLYEDKFDFENTPIKDNIELCAVWRTGYKVSFNSNGGSYVESQIVEDGKYATKPEDPKKDGYEFLGWYDTQTFGGNKFDFGSTPITGDITLYAGWNKILKVTFIFNGNSFSWKVEEGTKITGPETYGSYIFKGWYVDEALMQEFDFESTPIMGDMTLYADWNKGYEVKFESNGGSYVESQIVGENGYATKPEDPKKDGYEFLGWYSDGLLFDFEHSTINSDITLYAKWNGKTYTVTFNSNGGTEVESQIVDEGKHIDYLKEPKKDGYIFDGWYFDEELTKRFSKDTPIYENITLYAGWSKIFEVTFKFDGNSFALAVLEGSKIIAPETYGLYVFEGWYLDESLTQQFDFENTPITDYVTLYGKWDKGLVVKFDSNGGSEVKEQIVEKNKYAKEPETPWKYGYIFKGWYLDTEFMNKFDFENTPITDDITLYAGWKTGYEVDFVCNGQLLEIQMVEENGYAKKPQSEVHGYVNGYIIKGWYSDDQLINEFDFNMPIIESIKVFADGSKGYIVWFISDWEAIGSQVVEEGGYLVKPDNLTKNGYEFAGLYYDEKFEKEFDFNVPIKEDLKLFVKWNKKESTKGSHISSSTKKQSSHDSASDFTYDSLESNSTYSEEMNEAYQYAYHYGITTMKNIDDADMGGTMTRIAMAKMLSKYAINVLGKQADTSKTIKFVDVPEEMDKEYGYGVTLAYQLGIMGQNMPDNEFRPEDTVIRAEFVTALSRLLYGAIDGKYLYYNTHMKLLKSKGIISNTDPDIQEVRGYAMLMMMRAK